MNQSKIAVRYAKALFLLAQEKNKLDEVYMNMKIVENIFYDSKELVGVLNNANILQSEKNELIKIVFKDFDKLTQDFLILLIEKKRQEYITSISRLFSDLYRKEKGIIKLTTTTARKLSEELKESIKSFFKNAYKKEVELEEKQNNDIIGGIILRIDNNELNMSVQNQLYSIKKYLKSEKYSKKI